MLNLLLSFLFLFGNSRKDTIVLGVTQTVYTDSLPPSPTCTYYVAGDIILQGNFDLRGVTFLLKSDFRRNYILDKQTNKRIKQANGLVFGTNIRLCKARVNLDNCTFFAADSGMWGGIYLADSSSLLRLFQTNIQDSYNGIVQIDNSQIVAKQTHFLNNYVSLQLAGNRDTVRYCSFSAKPKTMKMPFDSVSATDYYHSFAHIKNAANKELHLQNKNLVLNLFSNSIYAIFIDVKHRLQLQENYFIENKLAAIYHQNGDLQVINQNEIHLPTTYKNTIQMQTERRKQGFPDSTTYGIYARNSHDNLSEGNIFSAEKPMQAIGYHGFDSDLKTFSNEFSNLRTAIKLEGSQDDEYSFRGARFNNNITAIHINRTGTTAPVIRINAFNCNDFVSTDVSPRTGLLLTGNGTINADNRLGGCNNENELSGRPSGNELRIVAGKHTGDNLDLPLPTNFTFVRNQLGGASINPLRYYRYRNENVGGVASVGTDVLNCPTLIDANIDTCYRTSTGVGTRQGKRETFVSPKAFLGYSVPNPSRYEGAAIRYQLPEGIKQAELIVRNNVGLTVHTETLPLGGEGSVHINTARWASGLYTYSLIVDGRLVQTRKMAVVK